jgi:hypothetical protein
LGIFVPAPAGRQVKSGISVRSGPKRNGQSSARNEKTDRPLSQKQDRREMMQSGSRMSRCGLAVLACTSAQPASAERGTIGEQSRATVRISVSVAPRFRDLAKTVEPTVGPGQPGGARLSSNMVRFTVVRMSPDAQDRAAGETSNAPQLLIVVPD